MYANQDIALSNKLGFCLDKEKLKTVVGGATSNQVGRIGTVWDDEYLSLNFATQKKKMKVKKSN